MQIDVNPKHASDTSMLDVLMNTALGFIVLFILAFIMVRPEAKPAPEVKAEFIIQVTWADGNPDDVDTWVQAPNGSVCSFRRREDGFMNLTKDDLGDRNDTVTLPDGSVLKSPINKEVVEIRGIIPGEHIANVHMYSKVSPEPTEVTVDLIRTKAPYGTIVSKKVVLQRGEEKTAFRFTVTIDGKVTDINQLHKDIAYENLNQYGGYPQPTPSQPAPGQSNQEDAE
jgi:hypothetical protein